MVEVELSIEFCEKLLSSVIEPMTEIHFFTCGFIRNTNKLTILNAIININR